jgi:hypothetical protein
MSNPEVIPQAGPRRSLRAYWTPLLMVAVAVMLPTMAVFRAMDGDAAASESEVVTPSPFPHWLPIPLMSAALLAGAFVGERTIRRQLALARVGHMADGTIDAVRRYRPSKKYRATWSFKALDGYTYEGGAMLNDIDAIVLTSGSAIRVCYDPSNPSNNLIESGFWAVEWE